MKVMFYLMVIFRISNPGDSISGDPERTALSRWGRRLGYIEVCNKGQVVWTSKYFCELKKTRYLKLRYLALSYVWEDEESCSLKAFFSYASQLSGAIILCFSTVFTLGSGCSLMATGYCSPSWLPWKDEIANDCDILLY